MKELIIYRCEICGNLILMLENSGVVPKCCGKDMTLMTANTVDADTEKHVPVIRREGANVQIEVGEKPHPMIEEHHISLIALLTDKGVYMRRLEAGEAPEAVFIVRSGEDLLSAYALCNIHGLWKSPGKE